MKKAVHGLVLAVFTLTIASCLDPALEVPENLNNLDTGEDVYDDGGGDDEDLGGEDGGEDEDLEGDDGGEGYDPKQDIPLPLVKVTSVTLDKTVLNLSAGATDTLTATVVKDDPAAVPVVWVSDDPDVASVEDNGDGTATVTAVKSGTVIIMAFAGGKRTDCTVKIPFVAGVYSKAGAKLEQANVNLPDALAWIKANGENYGNYVIVLGASETAAATYNIGVGGAGTDSSTGNTLVYVKITLRGVTSAISITKTNAGALFTVQGGGNDRAELTLEDITLVGYAGNTAALVVVGQTFSGNTYAGTLTMKTGSRIMGNISSVLGGGVQVAQGSEFVMEDGLIDKNQALQGGGVFLAASSTFTMWGGTIEDNTATNIGGGVYIQTNGAFIMEGGIIRNNKSSQSGGGVYISFGSFTMKGGFIKGNAAATFGAAVYINYSYSTYVTTFTKIGGTIYGTTEPEGTANKGTSSNTVHAIEKIKAGNTTDCFYDTTAGPGVRLDSTNTTGWSVP